MKMRNESKVSFLEEGSDELSGRFANTFLGLTSGNVILPVYVRGIQGVNKVSGSLSILGSVYDLGVQDWIPFSKSVKEKEISYFPPLPGMRNYLSGALYYDIIPIRHRYRGLRREQIRCVHFDPKVEEAIYLESGSFQYSIFNPSYSSVDAALELVGKRKRTSVAFSDKFAVLKAKNYKHLLFVYKGRNVGLYSKNDHAAVLPPQTHHLTEELSTHITCIKDN